MISVPMTEASAEEPQQTSRSTAAVWTPSGRGAVATIRIELAPDDSNRSICWPFRAASGRPGNELPIGSVSFGQWGSQPTEDVVVSRCNDTSFEIHCHGGSAAVRRILADLSACGFDEVAWQNQVGSELERIQYEFHELLSQAATLRTAAWIAGQSDRWQLLSNQLVEWHRSGDDSLAQASIAAALRWEDFGLHLTQPWLVVLAGRPNVGKSSLINALVGFERSIVFDEPGTTRDLVTADTVLDGWPMRFSDTAGQRSDANELEASGITLARKALADADCGVLVLDIHEPPSDEDLRLLAEWPEAVIVAHKADLEDRWGTALPTNAIRVSSLQQIGLHELSTQIVQKLIPRLPPDDAVIPLNERQIRVLRQSITPRERR